MINHSIHDLRPGLRACALIAWTLALVALTTPAIAQPLTHPNGHLDWIYPSGAQQGQTVDVEFGGAGGLSGAIAIHLEGAPGITISDVKWHDANRVTAKLVVAADAPLGRRMLRVVGGDNGLTNARSFLIGQLPEIQEPAGEDNTSVQDVSIPIVINGRLNPQTDVDRFRFTGQAGQSIVAVVMAHRIDVLKPHPQKDQGYLDASIEIVNDQGAVIASADDTLGLDPLVNCTLPADGKYTVVIKGLAYHGFPSAVYRLTLGDLPYPTAIFPTGGHRGELVEVEVTGVDLPAGTSVKVQVPTDDEVPLLDVLVPGATEGSVFFPFFCGSDPEIRETDQPHLREHAQTISHPGTVNGRFMTPGEEDWYVIELKAQEAIIVEVLADRQLRSPVDSRVEIYGATGGKLADNDDGALFTHECLHDYNSADSWLAFTAPAEGKYFIRLLNQAAESGNRAVYRLSIKPFEPDFTLFQWPDAVPIWGAGSTATFVVQELHRGGFDGEIELRVEGLPPGWTAPPSRISCGQYKNYNNQGFGAKTLMSITAPADATRGTMVPFRVVGKAVVNGRIIEHKAQPLSLLGNGHSDKMHLHLTRQAWAAVGTELDCRLETTVQEVSGHPGEIVQIPVKIQRTATAKGEIGLTVDGETTHVASAVQPPKAITPEQTELVLPLQIPADKPAGNYGIVVSRSWKSDLRGGRPGPCTPLIMLHVLPANATASK